MGAGATGASRARVAGLARPALISALSLAMISGGVPRGTPRPHQELASYPGTVSPTVGASGTNSLRDFAVTASRRSEPERMWASDPVRVANITWTWPAIMSVSAGA